MKLSEIIAVLPSLSKRDQQALRQALNKLTPPSDETDETAVAYDALRAVLHRALPYNAFKTTTVHAVWKREAPTLLQYVSMVWPETDTSRNLRLGVLNLMLNLLR